MPALVYFVLSIPKFISGTALITLPDGLSGGSSSKKGGYTIVSLPTNAGPNNGSSFSSKPNIKLKSNGHKRLGGGSNHSSPSEAEMNEIKVIPSTSANLSVHELERGELYDHIFNSYKYGTKNKTQIWDVMQQQSVQQTLIEGKNGKKKQITTILPFHPNQDVYVSHSFFIKIIFSQYTKTMSGKNILELHQLIHPCRIV